MKQPGNEDGQADANSDRARLHAVLKFDAKNTLAALATIRGFLHPVQKFRYNTNRSLMPLPIAFDNLTLPQAIRTFARSVFEIITGYQAQAGAD